MLTETLILIKGKQRNVTSLCFGDLAADDCAVLIGHHSANFNTSDFGAVDIISPRSDMQPGWW